MQDPEGHSLWDLTWYKAHAISANLTPALLAESGLVPSLPAAREAAAELGSTADQQPGLHTASEAGHPELLSRAGDEPSLGALPEGMSQPASPPPLSGPGYWATQQAVSDQALLWRTVVTPAVTHAMHPSVAMISERMPELEPSPVYRWSGRFQQEQSGLVHSHSSRLLQLILNLQCHAEPHLNGAPQQPEQRDMSTSSALSQAPPSPTPDVREAEPPLVHREAQQDLQMGALELTAADGDFLTACQLLRLVQLWVG